LLPAAGAVQLSDTEYGPVEVPVRFVGAFGALGVDVVTLSMSISGALVAPVGTDIVTVLLPTVKTEFIVTVFHVE